MDKYTSISCCRLCKSKSLDTIIAFGELPLANSYPKTKDAPEDFFPLTLVRCLDCGAVQLQQNVNPEIMFSNYLYSSSDSPALIEHFKQYAAGIVDKFNLNEYSQVTEIGANDSILLKEFANLYISNLYGVDPASNLLDRCKKNCPQAKIINKFFNLQTAKEIKKLYGPSDIVCANNVLAHVPDLDTVIEGVKELIGETGVLVFENAYLTDMIEKLYFDVCYSEHTHYHSIKPLVQYLAKFDLEIFDVKKVPTQGGSFRAFVKHKKNNKYQISKNVGDFVKQEVEAGLYNGKTYEDWVSRIHTLQNDFGRLYAKIADKGIVVYGAPAKLTLMSYTLGLNDKIVHYIVDDSPLKQGRFSPGLKIPIVSREHFLKNPPDYCLVAAWNFADSIIRANKQFKGKFIIPLPQLKII